MSITKSIRELISKQDHRILVLWAADCAEHVLAYFEEIHPNDDRPRQAVEAGRAWLCGEIDEAMKSVCKSIVIGSERENC